MRRTLSLRTILLALIAAPFLLAALPARAEESPEPVVSFVSGLAPDDLLNVRATPSAMGRTEARLPVGSPLKNFGCADVNGNPWCKVEEVDNPQVRGWAPARYLNPASAVVLTDTDMAFSATSPAAAPMPDLAARLGGGDETADPDAPKSADAIGRTAMEDAYTLAFAAYETASTAPGASAVPCARYVGQPMTNCWASVVHTGGDSAVTVTWPDGGTRIISFHAGLPSASDAPDEFRFTREGSLNMIRIGASERFEITDAVALGD
ncbi:SH3 domain-containing protein [Mesorhizobium sp. AR10]|nr:SH3 domain-containing protein [Mesorhizobium sp. AR10]